MLFRSLIRAEKPVTLSIEGLYPNPTEQKVNVVVGAPSRDKLTLVVTDVSGRKLIERIVSVDAGTNTIPLDVEAFSNGTYIVRVICSNNNCENVTGKFVKQR